MEYDHAKIDEMSRNRCSQRPFSIPLVHKPLPLYPSVGEVQEIAHRKTRQPQVIDDLGLPLTRKGNRK